MIQKILERKTLALEFFLLCVLLPTIIIVFKLAPFMFFFLWGATAYCMWVYRRHHYTNWKNFWGWGAVTWDNMKPILVRWAVCCVLMTLFIYWYDHARMFYMVENKPRLLIFLLFLYPLLSALPQEIIFCRFFFARYAPFFTSERAMVIASAVVFAYAHVLFINPVAPTLSLIAGYIFARTYAKTGSLALVTIEHGLYGNYLFIVGLGWYFYGGAVVANP